MDNLSVLATEVRLFVLRILHNELLLVRPETELPASIAKSPIFGHALLQPHTPYGIWFVRSQFYLELQLGCHSC